MFHCQEKQKKLLKFAKMVVSSHPDTFFIEMELKTKKLRTHSTAFHEWRQGPLVLRH